MIEGQRVIDFHGHVGRWDRYGAIDDADLMLSAMDSVGIDIACLFNIFHPDGATGNDLTAQFVARNPDRFVGFAYVSPLKPEGMIAELERAFDELNFVAIKLYPPYTSWPLDDSRWHPIYEFANERGVAVLIHTDESEVSQPKLLANVAQRYQNVKFVAGHSGNTPAARAQAITVARSFPNVYLETCSSFRTPGVIEQLVSEAGDERVLFGSDIPLMDPRIQIGKIITADISDDAKRQALGLNAMRILNLEI
ncbi:MAG: amidohydrolase family protein [SAR202 cluster bacterium]|jgi:hypothetical protein|nr:amidohydrolase family protein [SAR202 cluster bacterium]MDP6715425.1 amidohydrolase family protein [SAR202 cluster bacterium]